MADNANISGRDVTFTFYQDTGPVPVRTETIDVEELAEVVEDGVNGEDRQRFQKLTNGYRITISCFVESAKLIASILNDIANNDLRVKELNKAVGVVLTFRDGTRAAYVAKELSTEPWKLSIGGQNTRLKITHTFKARYFEARGV